MDLPTNPVENLDDPETSRLIGNSYIGVPLESLFMSADKRETSQDTLFHRRKKRQKEGLSCQCFSQYLSLWSVWH